MIFSGLLRANCQNSMYVHVELVLWKVILGSQFGIFRTISLDQKLGSEVSESLYKEAHVEAFRESDWNRILAFFKAMMVDGKLKEF